jgi:hypothetical protein
MTDEREVDLDVLRRERAREPIRIRIAGEDFAAPPELPFPAFRALGKLAGLDAADAAAMGPVLDALDVTMASLIGRDNWERVAAGLSSDDVMGLLQAVLVVYGVAEKGATPEDALGESRASARP